MTTTTPAASLTTTDPTASAIERRRLEGVELEGAAYRLFSKGVSPALVAAELGIAGKDALALQKQYIALAKPTAIVGGGMPMVGPDGSNVIRYGAGGGAEAFGGFTVQGPRADRVICECGANQAQHHAGSGRCALTFCRRFRPEEDREEAV